MIVAGIGSRKGVSGADVVAAIDAALVAYGLARKALATLATTDFKRDEAGILAAAKMLGLEIVVVEAPVAADPLSTGSTLASPSPLWGGIEGGGARTATSWQNVDRTASQTAGIPPPPRTPPHKGEGGVRVASKLETKILTHSALSLAVAGTPSVSETAALSAAGPGAKLLGPRVATGRVTCALAESETPT